MYSCISCLNLDIVEVFDTKIAHLLSEEDELAHKSIEARIKCDNYKADYDNLQGEREKQLNGRYQSSSTGISWQCNGRKPFHYRKVP